MVIAYFFLMFSAVIYQSLSRKPFHDYYNQAFWALFFGFLILLYNYVKNSGKMNDEHIHSFNLFIPMAIICSTQCYMAFMNPKHFESQESWAFYQAILWLYSLTTAMFLNMNLKHQYYFSLSGLTIIFYNLETQSSDPTKLRYETYPNLIIVLVLLMVIAYIHSKFQKYLVETLIMSYNDPFISQKVLINKMNRNVILKQAEKLFINFQMLEVLKRYVSNDPELLKHFVKISKNEKNRCCEEYM